MPTPPGVGSRAAGSKRLEAPAGGTGASVGCRGVGGGGENLRPRHPSRAQISRSRKRLSSRAFRQDPAPNPGELDRGVEMAVLTLVVDAQLRVTFGMGADTALGIPA